MPLTSDPLGIAGLNLPQLPEPARHGAGGVDCRGCTAEDGEHLWTDEHWRVHTTTDPQPLFLVLINPRRHYEDLPDLPPERAAELGPLLQRTEAALRSLGDVGQVHTHKWGDGGAHLHLWQIVRPYGMVQARGGGADSLAPRARAASGRGVAGRRPGLRPRAGPRRRHRASVAGARRAGATSS